MAASFVAYLRSKTTPKLRVDIRADVLAIFRYFYANNTQKMSVKKAKLCSFCYCTLIMVQGPKHVGISKLFVRCVLVLQG